MATVKLMYTFSPWLKGEKTQIKNTAEKVTCGKKTKSTLPVNNEAGEIHKPKDLPFSLWQVRCELRLGVIMSRQPTPSI